MSAEGIIAGITVMPETVVADSGADIRPQDTALVEETVPSTDSSNDGATVTDDVPPGGPFEEEKDGEMHEKQLLTDEDVGETSQDDDNKHGRKKRVGQVAARFSKAKLFCRVNGHNHAALIVFGHESCRLCREDLAPTTSRTTPGHGGPLLHRGPPSHQQLPDGVLITGPTESNYQPYSSYESDSYSSDTDDSEWLNRHTGPLPLPPRAASTVRQARMPNGIPPPPGRSQYGAPPPGMAGPPPPRMAGPPPRGQPTPGVLQNVLHSVEYHDKSGTIIGNENWEDTFDLSTARKFAGQNVGQNARCIFEVTTVLNTSLNGRRHQPYPQLPRQYILENPNVVVKLHTRRLAIHSTLLIQLLRRFVPYYPSVDFNAEILQLEEPFPLIAHHYKELDGFLTAKDGKRTADDPELAVDGPDSNEYRNDDAETTSVQHLKSLLEYFQKTVLHHVLDEEARHARGVCTFRMLWLLYRPDITIYLEELGRLSAFVVQSVDTDPAIMSTVGPERPGSYTIKVWNLRFDGHYVSRRLRTIVVAPFEGERKIVSLRLIPRMFIDQEDDGETRRSLEEEGQKWYELLPGRQVHYSGPLLYSRERQVGAMGNSNVDYHWGTDGYILQSAQCSRVH